jgi:hypothetical protein
MSRSVCREQGNARPRSLLDECAFEQIAGRRALMSFDLYAIYQAASK